MLFRSRFGEDLAERIDAWHEARPVGTKSLFFARWIAGSAATSKADQLLGSLGVGGLGASDGRRRAYAAMVDAIVLDARAHGNTIVEIEHRWGVRDVEGVEEAWRDTAIWLLAGHASVLEVRAFFHHLREACHATTDQVKAASRRLRRLQASARGVVEDLKHCSPLGSVLRGVRLGRAGSGQLVGVATIRTLEEAGIRSAADLRGQTIDDLVALGVQRRFATQIVEYVRRRLR